MAFFGFPPDATALQKLYVMLLVILGIALLGGILAWVLLAFADKDMPEGLATLVSIIGGGLIGVIAQPTADKPTADKPTADKLT